MSQAAASRNAVCKVPGCGAPIPDDNTVGKKCRICGFHMKTPSFELEGQNVRFCSLCRRFEEVTLFDGEKKSCRASLEKHNLRRRKHKPAIVLEEEPSNSGGGGGGGAIPGSPPAHDAAGGSSAATPSLSAAGAPEAAGVLLGGAAAAAGWAGWDESRLVFQGNPWMASPFLDQRSTLPGGQVPHEGRRGGVSVDSGQASSLVSAGSGGLSTGTAPPRYQQYQSASPPQQQQQQQQAGNAALTWRMPLVQPVPAGEGTPGGLGAARAAGGVLLPSPHALAAAAVPSTAAAAADGGGETAQPDMNAMDTLSAMLMSLDLQEQPHMPAALSSFRLGDLSMVMGSAELESFRSWLPTFVGDSMPLDNVPLDSLPREFWEQHKDELAQMLRPGFSLPYSQAPADAVPQQAHRQAQQQTQRQVQQQAELEAQQQAQRQAAWVAQALAGLQQPPGGVTQPPPGTNLAVLALQQHQQQEQQHQQQDWQRGERQPQEWEQWHPQPSPQWQQPHPQPQQAAQQRCRPPASEVAGLLGGHGLPTPEQLQQALQQQQQQLLQELQRPVTSQGSQGSGGRPAELQNMGYTPPPSSLFM